MDIVGYVLDGGHINLANESLRNGKIALTLFFKLLNIIFLRLALGVASVVTPMKGRKQHPFQLLVLTNNEKNSKLPAGHRSLLRGSPPPDENIIVSPGAFFGRSF